MDTSTNSEELLDTLHKILHKKLMMCELVAPCYSCNAGMGKLFSLRATFKNPQFHRATEYIFNEQNKRFKRKNMQLIFNYQYFKVLHNINMKYIYLKDKVTQQQNDLNKSMR